MSARGDDRPDRRPHGEQESGPGEAPGGGLDHGPSSPSPKGGESSEGSLGRVEAGPNGPDADGPAPGAEGHPSDEESLRRLMQRSVQGIEPSPAALDELRRAVPRRRARKRQALVGAVATVIVAAAAVPTLSQGDLVPGGDDKSVQAGDEQSSRPATETTSKDDDAEDDDSPSEKRNGGKDGAEPDESDPGEPSGDPTSDQGGEGTPPAASTCGSDQLGQGTAVVDTPDAEGRIQGSFKVVNVSGTSCQVEGDGVIGASPQGTSRAGGVQVMRHTPGDSSGLVAPAESPTELVLEPGSAYVVKFAWVPEAGEASARCGDTSPPNGSGGGTAQGPGTEVEPQEGVGTPGPGAPGGSGDAGPGGGGNGGPGDGSGSVTLSHVPEESDAAVADTVLPGACSGTVYRTGVLEAG